MQKSDFYRRARADLPGPLDGVRVLEATTTWAGPMCGCVLADLGADVIKLEPPDGEVARVIPPVLPDTELSFMHQTVNRNKRSLTLDLRKDEGRETFLRVVSTCDVVVENFRPGTLDRWGSATRRSASASPTSCSSRSPATASTDRCTTASATTRWRRRPRAGSR